MTEFSPRLEFVEHAAQELLKQARRHRKRRDWALEPAQQHNGPLRKPIYKQLASHDVRHGEETVSYTIDLWRRNGKRVNLQIKFRWHLTCKPTQQLIVIVRLGEISDRDKKRLQQHIPHEVDGEGRQAWFRTVWRKIESRSKESRAEDHTQLLQGFPEIEAELIQYKDAYNRFCQGERYGARLIRIDKDTEIKDIQAQLLAYLFQDRMVQWDEVEAWFQRYRLSFGRNDTCAERFLMAREFALPLKANALRPAPPPPSPDQYYSVPKAAHELGLTAHQLRYRIENGAIQLNGVRKRGKYLDIPKAEVERLKDEPTPALKDKEGHAQCLRTGRELGVPDATIKQTIYRERKKDPARSWEDIEATIKKNAAKSRRRKGEISVSSREEISIEDQIALFHQLRAETEPGSDEWATYSDALRELERGHQDAK